MNQLPEEVLGLTSENLPEQQNQDGEGGEGEMKLKHNS